MIISLHDVNKTYPGAVPLHVLKDINLEIARGELVSIMGASGAGKSTLLHILGTLSTPDKGTLSIDGTDVLSLSGKGLSDFRNRKIGFVFQFHHLLPEFTSLENVMIPALIAGRPAKEAKSASADLLADLGLSARLSHKPSQLSGGEQQRVAIARALVNNPSVLFADEPSGNLDSRTSADVLSLLKDSSRRFHQTIVMITHDKGIAQMADRSIRIEDGKIMDSPLRERPMYLIQSREVE